LNLVARQERVSNLAEKGIQCVVVVFVLWRRGGKEDASLLMQPSTLSHESGWIAARVKPPNVDIFVVEILCHILLDVEIRGIHIYSHLARIKSSSS
jgi:hypothetical protein